MKAEDLKGKTVDELNKTLLDLKKQQFNLRIQLSQGQLENTSTVRKTRRAIARVKTFITKQTNGVAAVAPKAEAKKKAPAKKAVAKKEPTKKSDDEEAQK